MSTQHLRSPEMEKKYIEYRKHVTLDPNSCQLCTEPIVKSFKYWRVINNSFPYDVIAKTHHMILPMRHVTEGNLTNEEIDEYKTIKTDFINPTYTDIIESTQNFKSIPGHFHLHLIIPKD